MFQFIVLQAWVELCLGKDMNTAQKLFKKGIAAGLFTSVIFALYERYHKLPSWFVFERCRKIIALF